jgi:hypothetical protein
MKLELWVKIGENFVLEWSKTTTRFLDFYFVIFKPHISSFGHKTNNYPEFYSQLFPSDLFELLSQRAKLRLSVQNAQGPVNCWLSFSVGNVRFQHGVYYTKLLNKIIYCLVGQQSQTEYRAPVFCNWLVTIHLTLTKTYAKYSYTEMEYFTLI